MLAPLPQCRATAAPIVFCLNLGTWANIPRFQNISRIWINVFVTSGDVTYDDVIRPAQGSPTSSYTWFATELYLNHHGYENLSWIKKKTRGFGIRYLKQEPYRNMTSTGSWQGHRLTIDGHRNLPLEDLIEDDLKESWIKERKESEESDLYKNWSVQLLKLPGVASTL